VNADHGEVDTVRASNCIAKSTCHACCCLDWIPVGSGRDRREGDCAGAELICYGASRSFNWADIEAARRVFPVATVQNGYNLVDRTSEDVPV
jgi:hypothetical protein